jgi:hypothetical protein
MLIAVFTKSQINPIQESLSGLFNFNIILLNPPPGLPGVSFLQVPRSNSIRISVLGTLLSIVMAVCGGQDELKNFEFECP